MNRYEQKAYYLFEEYSKIILDFFPGITYIDEFAAAFNQIFIMYQDANRKKMDPISLREGRISCSSAAGITGTWWRMIKNLEPAFFIEDVRKSTSSKASAHVIVGLPENDLVDLQKLKSAYYARANGVIEPDLHIVDFTHRDHLSHTHEKLVQVISPIIVVGIIQFLSNRMKVLSLPKGRVSLDFQPNSLNNIKI